MSSARICSNRPFLYTGTWPVLVRMSMRLSGVKVSPVVLEPTLPTSVSAKPGGVVTAEADFA
jgi:hypothetical protein